MTCFLVIVVVIEVLVVITSTAVLIEVVREFAAAVCHVFVVFRCFRLFLWSL